MRAGTVMDGPSVAEILDRVDLAALVERDAGPGRREGSRWRFRCPNPAHEDRTPSFDVTQRNGKWWASCRAENVNVDAVDYLVWIGHARDRGEAIAQLGEMVGFRRDDRRPLPIRTLAPKRPLTLPEPAPELDLEPLRPTDADDVLARFLSDRGWSPAAATMFGLEVVLDSRGRLRVRFPWLSLADPSRTVYYQDRAAWPDHGKAERWRSPGGGGAPTPFGMHRLAILDELATSPTEYEAGVDVFVCEGPSDAVALADAFPDTVTLGVPGNGRPHRPWERALRGLNVFLCADADAQGERYRAQWAEALAPHAAAVYQVLVPPEHGDVSAWRLALGEGFHDAFLDAVGDAIEAVRS